MNTKYTAVLLDTVSIQPYIFGSNRLKENIGASYIIEQSLFRKIIPEILGQEPFVGTVFDGDHWKNNVAQPIPPGYKCGIGYIGGGNALVLFSEFTLANKFIEEISKCVLIRFPGIRLAVGIDEQFETSEPGFKLSMEKLNKSLRECKNLDFIQTRVFKSGIVADCPSSNEGVEGYNVIAKRWVSHEINGKINAVTESNQSTFRFLNEENRKKYSFPTEFEDLGQLEDKGYIAVVHIDGNGLGKRFMNQSDLTSYRSLSYKISLLADEAMRNLCNSLCESIEPSGNGHSIDKHPFRLKPDKDDNTNYYLPIRPILVGGDDITFVSEGRLGISLAKKLLEIFSKSAHFPNETLTACAGIAIVKTKYPFYKAYQLAEELLGEAKMASRPDKGSYLSYLVSSSGFSGSLESIVEQQFQTDEGILRYGPYCVVKKTDDNPAGNDFEKMIAWVEELTKDESKWPRSAFIALRNVLREDQHSRELFLAQMKFRDRALPQALMGKYGATLWNNGRTPFYDLADLSEFYTQLKNSKIIPI